MCFWHDVLAESPIKAKKAINGAMNLLKRAMGYMPMAGAGLTQPRTRQYEAAKAEKPRIPQASAGRVSKGKWASKARIVLCARYLSSLRG